jgi:hypothetical protein
MVELCAASEGLPDDDVFKRATRFILEEQRDGLQ